MKGNRSIQIKAAFLLMVFSLNTLVGFACSVGLKMGFNTPHHGKEAEAKVHIHKDGKKHVHKSDAVKDHHAKTANTSKKDDCCKEKVVKLQTEDKNFQYAKTNTSAPVYIVPGNFLTSLSFKIVQPNLPEYIACQFHPPPRDIRIAIQSFQI
ncbi:MAG: hypothetical protein EPO58_15935 [Chitinophagaceae bacterium]|nr:MAG: hypothetical protein EPO58_15935 [Chitinophagaceae bacterium]